MILLTMLYLSQSLQYFTFCLQCRYVEAVIPTLTLLHPSSIIDGLHSQCLDRLKRQNRLKKGLTVAEMAEDVDIHSGMDRQFSTETRSRTGEMKTSSIQALFTLARV